LVRKETKMRQCSAWSCLVAVVVTFAGINSAVAKPSEVDAEAESEVWIKKGVKLRKEGEHAAALEAFLRAHETKRTGRTVALVGLARQSLRQWPQAMDCLLEALESKDTWIEKNRPPLEEALAAVKAHVGWLLLSGPAGSRLWVSEVSMGTLPMREMRLAEGVYVARVEKDGMQPWSQTITIVGGKTVEVVAMLEQAISVVSQASARSLALDGTPKENRGSRVGSILGAAIAGAGLAVAVTGTVVWIQQESGSYGSFDSGVTGPALLAGGIIGMVAGGGLLYWSRERTVSLGMSASGPVVGGRF
jgi:hypothetical protein